MTVLVLGAYLASANAQTPKQSLRHAKNSGCTSQDGMHYSGGYCVSGEGGCYYCEHTDQYGTYACNEAPNPADGINCFAIDVQDI